MDPTVSDPAPAPATAPAPALQGTALATGTTTTTPGWQTSEFWLHALLIVGLITTSFATAGLPPRWAAACATVSAASYGISRGLAKLFNGN